MSHSLHNLLELSCGIVTLGGYWVAKGHLEAAKKADRTSALAHRVIAFTEMVPVIGGLFGLIDIIRMLTCRAFITHILKKTPKDSLEKRSISPLSVIVASASSDQIAPLVVTQSLENRSSSSRFFREETSRSSSPVFVEEDSHTSFPPIPFCQGDRDSAETVAFKPLAKRPSGVSASTSSELELSTSSLPHFPESSPALSPPAIQPKTFMSRAEIEERIRNPFKGALCYYHPPIAPMTTSLSRAFRFDVRDGILAGILEGDFPPKIMDCVQNDFPQVFNQALEDQDGDVPKAFTQTLSRVNQKIIDTASISDTQGATITMSYIDFTKGLIYTATLGTSESVIINLSTERVLPLSLAKEPVKRAPSYRFSEDIEALIDSVRKNPKTAVTSIESDAEQPATPEEVGALLDRLISSKSSPMEKTSPGLGFRASTTEFSFDTIKGKITAPLNPVITVTRLIPGDMVIFISSRILGKLSARFIRDVLSDTRKADLSMGKMLDQFMTNIKSAMDAVDPYLVKAGISMLPIYIDSILDVQIKSREQEVAQIIQTMKLVDSLAESFPSDDDSLFEEFVPN